MPKFLTALWGRIKSLFATPTRAVGTTGAALGVVVAIGVDGSRAPRDAAGSGALIAGAGLGPA